MELKRYVRLSCYKGIVIVDNKDNKYFIHKDINRHFNLYGDRTKTSLHESKIIDTKDTILELAEVGDMVELDGGNECDNDLHIIINALDGDLITYDNLFIYNKRDKEIVKALWVKQDNETFKRYEVK